MVYFLLCVFVCSTTLPSPLIIVIFKIEIFLSGIRLQEVDFGIQESFTPETKLGDLGR